MRQSKGYVLLFTAILTIVCAVLLAGAYTGLRERTLLAESVDKKSKILGAVGLGSGLNSKAIDSLYNAVVVETVLDYKGNLVKGVDIKDVDVAAQYKTFMKNGTIPAHYPLYKVRSEVDSSKFESFIVPLYGNGLWDNIWGYVSVGNDFNTITGAIFDHKAETPGLGARITDGIVQERFKGKKLFNEAGQLVSVKMLKGEGNDLSSKANPEHYVDGMAGATMTANGLNAMLQDYMIAYRNFFKTSMASNKSVSGGGVTIPRNFK